MVSLNDLGSNTISYNYPSDIINNVYRTSPTITINDMYSEETRILLLDDPSPTHSPSRSLIHSPRFSYSPSYTPNQRSRGASSSCSIGDPNEELNTSGSPVFITSEPLNFHVSTIYVPKARLRELEDLESNLSTIVGNSLMEYIYNQNMTHTDASLQTSTQESLQTSPQDSGDDTDT